MTFNKAQGCLVSIIGLFSFVIFIVGLSLVDQNIEDIMVLIPGGIIFFIATGLFNFAFNKVGIEIAVYEAARKHRGFDAPDYKKIKSNLLSEQSLKFKLMVTWIVITAIQTAIVLTVVYYNALYFGFSGVVFIVYAIVLIMIPKLFKLSLLGYTYQHTKYFVPSRRKPDAFSTGYHLRVRNTFFFPLKLITTKAPPYIYNLKGEVVFETPTVRGRHVDIISTRHSSYEILTIMSHTRNFKWSILNTKQETLVHVNRDGNFEVTFDSSEGKYTYKRRRFLSRAIQIYKDDKLYVETKIKRVRLRKGVMISSYHDENEALSIALVYLVLYGTII